jgi:hypothetical protein
MKSMPSAGLTPNRFTLHRLLPVLLALLLLAAPGVLPAAAAPASAAAASGAAPAAADASALADLAAWLLRLVGVADPGAGPAPVPPPTLRRTGGPIGPLIDPNGQSSEPPGASGFHGSHGGVSHGSRGY